MGTQLIYHIAEARRWEGTASAGAYGSDYLESGGFIHCCTLEQVLGVANALFLGQSGLVLLVIEPTKVRSEIRYEALEGEEQFPHIYGPLGTDAVVRVVPFEPGADGGFQLPPDVSAASR